jgi:flagellar biosynthesis/type III secretory pathway chaperone
MTQTVPADRGFFEQELRRWEQLLHVLEREKSALIDNDVDALLQITPEKSRLIATFLTARPQWQPGQNASSSSPLAEMLQQRQLQARELNQTNGILMQRLSNQNQAALAVLRGQPAPSFYGPDGQRVNSTLFGSLG